MKEEQFNLEEIKAKALSQLRTGKSLYGKDGAFGPMLKQFLEAALEEELNSHLTELEREKGNRKNGKVKKTLRTDAGEIEIESSRDRLGSFEPSVVKKRETILADSLQDKIIGLYGLGMSYRDISKHIEEMYDMEISHETLSNITDRVLPLVTEWQNRSLERVYTIVWLDAMHYKVKDGGVVKNRAVYNILAINLEGKKEVIGAYSSENEGAKFWLGVLTDLKNRGLQDILIACIDNLSGFAEAIASIFPQTEIQTCVVHQIRNSIKYVASKDQKEFISHLKPVYQASTKEKAEQALAELAEKWEKKYPMVIKSWHNNWDKLSVYFKYPEEIRRLIYTNNAIEGYHRQIRKVTKTKGSFPNDQALLKLIYLAHKNIAKKWTQPIQNWSLIISQLAIWFEGRFKVI